MAYTMNKAQQQACLAKYRISQDGTWSYLQFRRRFKYHHTLECFMGQWCGMVLGIEWDGHAHT
jgi:hypothetical protein